MGFKEKNRGVTVFFMKPLIFANHLPLAYKNRASDLE
jgi:hypothetical protein